MIVTTRDRNRIEDLYKMINLLTGGYIQGVKVSMLGRQNERNFCFDRLALTSMFGLCFMSVCLSVLCQSA